MAVEMLTLLSLLLARFSAQGHYFCSQKPNVLVFSVCWKSLILLDWRGGACFSLRWRALAHCSFAKSCRRLSDVQPPCFHHETFDLRTSRKRLSDIESETCAECPNPPFAGWKRACTTNCSELSQ
jgi:hypothetical protein